MVPPDHPFLLYQFSSAGGWQSLPARVIGEASVSLTVNGEAWLTFMCTPTDLEALSVGFLFNEGLIQSAAEVAAVTTCADGCNVDVWLHRPVQKPAQWRRTSGCAGGLTSAARLTSEPGLMSTATIPPEMIMVGMDQLLKAQELYREVRGVHCSAISNGQELVYRAEDIGRHNTLDKLAGLMLLHPTPLAQIIVLTTGRISSEMLQKSSRLGAAAVVSRTSPTALSIELAEEAGITLVGYARRNQFTVYTHPERLQVNRLIRMVDPAVQPA